MKYSILLITVVALFTFPYSVKSQGTIKKERADLDSLVSILGGPEKTNFIFGIEQPPVYTGTKESNGATTFMLKKTEDSLLNSCLCHCYCACKMEGGELAFFRLEDVMDVKLDKSNNRVSLFFKHPLPEAIQAKNNEAAQTVYNLFKELKTLCNL